MKINFFSLKNLKSLYWVDFKLFTIWAKNCHLALFLLLIFSMIIFHSLNAQPVSPMLSLFRHQFFAYPFSGLGFRTLHNTSYPLEKIYFHTQIPFALSLKPYSTFNSHIFFITNLKMYQENNFPVKTPDYKISYNLSYQWDSTFQSFLAIQHHSNGQTDSLIGGNGSVNFNTGNFSVNSLQTYWIKKFHSNYLKFIVLQTEHLFFYFSMGYMKKFYFHHATHFQLFLYYLNQQKLKIFHHINTAIFLQPNRISRFKFETIFQLQYKNWNLMPFLRVFYGPDEYNSRYLYQNFQISLGLSAIMNPIYLLTK